jgi:hypothetical protein
MNILQNLDLFSVGLATAATGVLGFVIFFSNKKSITNKTFLGFAIITILWSVINYLTAQPIGSYYGLLFIRLTVFLGLFHALFFYQLFTVFPDENFTFSNRYRYLMVPWALCVAALTLTPLIFRSATTVLESGRVTEAQPGLLIPLYGITIGYFIIGGIVKL